MDQLKIYCIIGNFRKTDRSTTETFSFQKNETHSLVFFVVKCPSSLGGFIELTYSLIYQLFESSIF